MLFIPVEPMPPMPPMPPGPGPICAIAGRLSSAANRAAPAIIVRVVIRAVIFFSS
jgi:hypothetical protein